MGLPKTQYYDLAKKCDTVVPTYHIGCGQQPCNSLGLSATVTILTTGVVNPKDQVDNSLKRTKKLCHVHVITLKELFSELRLTTQPVDRLWYIRRNIMHLSALEISFMGCFFV